MIDISGIFALDGHDGSGKTALAQSLAARAQGSYQRTFHGATGEALLAAGRVGDVSKVVAISEEAIKRAIASAGNARPVVLDRGWMTPASLVDWGEFRLRWHLWIPTILCWADLATTLNRLSLRSEASEAIETHIHYLGIYLSLADRTGTRVIRTDLDSEQRCSDLMLQWLKSEPPPQQELFTAIYPR